MKFLPKPKPIRQVDQSVSQGAELAGGVLVFFLIGFGLDSWLNTVPVFMVGCTIFGVVGFFVRMYYSYNQEMARHEATRADNSRGQGK